MAFFRKIASPERTFEAMRWPGITSVWALEDILKFEKWFLKQKSYRPEMAEAKYVGDKLVIRPGLTAEPGDWVIFGKGCFGASIPEFFEANYEKVEVDQ